MVVESKTDESFTQQQFAIEGYHLPFRRDRNALGGGVMIFVREDIPVKEVFCDNVALNIEGIFVEINLRKKNGYCLVDIVIQNPLSRIF